MTHPTIQLGNAPCSWGTLEFEGMALERIGYRQMLEELAAAGYTGTELGDWGFMPTNPESLASHLAEHNLDLTGAFVPVALKNPEAHASGVVVAVRTARLLKAVSFEQSIQPFLVLADDNGTANPVRSQNAGRVTPDMGLTDAEWHTFAQGAQHIAKAVHQETGLRTVFHHHCAGYVETPAEIARLLSLTDPSLLGLVFDTGHYAFGAGPDGCQSIMQTLDRFADRIWYVHFKDYDPGVAHMAAEEGWDYIEAIRHGVFCELGQGCVNFPAVLAWLTEHRYQGYITVEQDILPGMGQPKESARRSRVYLQELGL